MILRLKIKSKWLKWFDAYLWKHCRSYRESEMRRLRQEFITNFSKDEMKAIEVELSKVEGKLI